MPTREDLKYFQAMPLDIKIGMTKTRIREWVSYYGIEGVYVSFSGGKDSTVLLHLVRELYPDIPAVFVDTGLEYPEIRAFVKTFDNVVWLKPEKSFKQVIEEYGYPMISKEVSNTVYGARKGQLSRLNALNGLRLDKNGKKSTFNKTKYRFLLDAPFSISDKCCDIMKKNPIKKYEKKSNRVPLMGQLAEESRKRTTAWIQTGCNAFDSKRPMSNPMSFWTEQDVLRYIKEYNIDICNIYGNVVIDYDSQQEIIGQTDFSDFGLYLDNRELITTGCSRTGCMFCGFGCHLEKDGAGRFELMKKTHPKQYDYIMRPTELGGLNFKEVIDWINEKGQLNIRY